jgi:hypothetical protein
MRKPTPAMVVALAALFVALGGVGIAANGQSLILGSTNNSATAQTRLAAPVNAAALRIDNTNTGADATSLSLLAAPGHQAFKVNTQTKIRDLNADQLDGRSSEYFLPKTAKAADSDKLDGIDAGGFMQGGGRIYARHLEGVATSNTDGTLLDVPGVLTVIYHCGGESGAIAARLTLASDNLGVVRNEGPSSRYFHIDSGTPLNFGISLLGNDPDPALFVDMLGSRPFNRVLFVKGVLVDAHLSMSWHKGPGTCSFQGVAEVFDG